MNEKVKAFVQGLLDNPPADLAVALAESCVMEYESPRGASIDLSKWSSLPVRALLFGEAQGRVVVSTPDPAAVLAIAGRHGVPATEIGKVGEIGGLLAITVGKQRFEAPVSRLSAEYHGAIPAMMTRLAESDAESRL